MKPVVFFSHSARDRDVILPIRDRLLAGTGNSIDVFMSSDGTSIPFGRNWLKEVEDALVGCKLMFVWLTPTSAKSSWIPFECGHAYARGIRVVPVGFLGMTLEQISSPLNMLQGFDITSGSGLNNIVAVINDQFKLTFPNLFDKEFYDNRIEANSPENNPDILRFIKVIKCEFRPVNSGGVRHIKSDCTEIVKEVLKGHKISFTERKERLYGVGFRIESTKNSEGKQCLDVAIDPLALNATWKVWTDILRQIFDFELPYAFMTATLTADWELPDDGTLVGSRLLNSDVSFETSQPHVIYRYRNIDFRFNIEKSTRILARDVYSNTEKDLVLLIPRENEFPIPLYSLMKLFEERHVIEAAKARS